MDDIELWFEGYIGIDQRITVTKLPSKFNHEAWEVLDFMLNDEPSPDLGICAEEQGFYRFKLGVESGFEVPHENEWAFNIEDCEKITNGCKYTKEDGES